MVLARGERPYDYMREVALFSYFGRFLAHADSEAMRIEFIEHHLSNTISCQRVCDVWLRFFKLHEPYRRARRHGTLDASLLYIHRRPPCMFSCVARAFTQITATVTATQVEELEETFPINTHSPRADPNWETRMKARWQADKAKLPVRSPSKETNSTSQGGRVQNRPIPTALARELAQERQKSLRAGLKDEETQWAIEALRRVHSQPVLQYFDLYSRTGEQLHERYWWMCRCCGSSYTYPRGKTSNLITHLFHCPSRQQPKAPDLPPWTRATRRDRKPWKRGGTKR